MCYCYNTRSPTNALLAGQIDHMQLIAGIATAVFTTTKATRPYDAEKS